MVNKMESHPLEGKKAPVFSLESGSGATVKLSGLKGKIVVLYFYPKDNTSGCTLEAKEFRDLRQEFDALGAVVLGVSPDSAASHCKFADKYELGFELLADTDHTLAEQYGVWAEKSMYGKKYMGIVRTTFLIDGKGKIRRVWSKVKPAGHAAEMLDAVRELATS